MKIVLNIIKYIVLIILIIFLVATIAVNIASSTILSKDYIFKKLDETNYYSTLYSEVESSFENYIYQSGLEEDVIKNIVTEEEIKQDTIQIINNLYSKEVVNIDVSKIENRLQENIDNSLEGQNISNATKESIKQFIGQITNAYKDTIVHTKYENSINNILTKVTEYVEKAKTILLVADVVLIVLLLLLSAKKIVKGTVDLGIAILGVGIFNIAVNVIVNAKVKIDYITIISDGFSMTIRSVLHDIMNIINTSGIILVIVGIIIIFISNVLIMKKKQEE